MVKLKKESVYNFCEKSNMTIFLKTNTNLSYCIIEEIIFSK